MTHMSLGQELIQGLILPLLPSTSIMGHLQVTEIRQGSGSFIFVFDLFEVALG